MPLTFEERPPQSPLIERIWRTQSDSFGEFTSIALNLWQMCVWSREGKLHLTVRGPETKPTTSYCPPDADFFGVVFKVGTVMPLLPASRLVDSDTQLPASSDQRFWLHGKSWQFPTYDNVDIFLDKLVNENVLVSDPIIDAAIEGRSKDLSLRSVQRRFLITTGLSHATLFQIERARQATILLRQGISILDTVDLTGYADQPHLTRALKRWIGQTPAQLLRNDPADAMSFLFKTRPLS